MNITILGTSKPKAVTDTLGFQLGQTLSALGHRLSVGASAQGVSESVRRGAAEAPRRHVRSYYVRAYNERISENRSHVNGYYFIEQWDVLDRISLVRSASAVVFLSICRANIGTALNLLYEQREDTRKRIDETVSPRLLLFHSSIQEAFRSSELFGCLFDDEDHANYKAFTSLQDALALIGDWDDRPKLYV